MQIHLDRVAETKDSTVGRLWSNKNVLGECFTLEDGFRDPKVPGETRIPAGEYRVSLRTEGAIHAGYLKRFGTDFHKGMLLIEAIPNFKYVMLHCGNTVKDTEGCPLIGTKIVDPKPGGSFTIAQSEKAYRKFYPPVRDALLAGDVVTVVVRDPVKLEPLVA